MNKKDMAQIRRRLNPEKCSIPSIVGCFVNDQGDVITTFDRPLINMPKEDIEEHLALFKKVLSGTEGQNLLHAEFTPEQVMESPEYNILKGLRDTRLRDDGVLDYFCEKVRSSLVIEGSYVILLLTDTYDVPRHFKDGERQEDAETNMFTYVMCAVCPVKLRATGLAYDAGDSLFHAGGSDFAVCAPECGFMFPAFEEGGANLYRALYYTKDQADNKEELVRALFGTPMPAPAAEQKQTIGELLENALQEECSVEVMQAVQETVRTRIDEKKQAKDPEPPVITVQDMESALAACGVSEEKTEAFRQQYDQVIGTHNSVPAVNITPPRQFEVRTPDVVIKVSPERTDLVETRVIDGLKYILIRADEGVEVNGVNVSIR